MNGDNNIPDFLGLSTIYCSEGMSEEMIMKMGSCGYVRDSGSPFRNPPMDHDVVHTWGV